MTSHSKPHKDLQEIQKPSTLVSLTFTNKGKSSLLGLEKFKNLIELDLSGNALSSQIITILELKFLKKLSLARNSISIIWDLPKTLEQLNLSENFIMTLDSTVPSLTRLQALDVSQNCIVSLKPLAGLKQLKSLYAGKNKISEIEGVLECPELLEVDLECNSVQNAEGLLMMESIAVVNLKGNPCLKNEDLGQVFGFAQYEEGVFCRNLEKIQVLKSSKFKLVGKKLKKEENQKEKKRTLCRSRLTSMQEIYDQVISEDPEMESLNSSGSEEMFAEDFKKPQVSKLQLNKIEGSFDKVSCEKWSTKPESSLEFLLDELIQYCQLDQRVDKTLSDDRRLEGIFKLLKDREDERKSLLMLNKELESQLEFCRSQHLQSVVEEQWTSSCQQLEDVKTLRTQLRDLEERMSVDKKSFMEREEKFKEKIRDLEEEKFSSRFNFSYSYESEFSEYIDADTSKFPYKSVPVPNEVAEYIQNLLKKISRLVSKSKKLRNENQRLKLQIRVKPPINSSSM